MQTEQACAYTMVGDVGQIFEPPRRVAVADAVEENVMIATPGGYAGKWSGDQTPYMVEPMNLLSSREYGSVVFAGPARSGKTQAIIDGGIGYIVTCDPSDTLVVHMTEEAARRYSRLRVKRMLNNSPALKAKMSTHNHDDNVLGKYFKNGTALILAWPSPTQLSAQDYKYVFLSDYDRMPDDTGEGDVYSLAMKRTQTFMSGGMCAVESSPGRDFTDPSWKPSTPFEAPPVGGILGLYNSGDRRIWHWNCVDCKEAFPVMPGLALFNLPPQDELMHQIRKNGAKATAESYNRIVCPHCGSMLAHEHKNKMNLGGFWKAESGRRNSIASFWLGGIAAKFQTWESLLEKEFLALAHYAGTGEQEKLKATRNTDQGIPYIPVGASEKLTAKELEDRAEDLPKRTVPEGCRFLLAAIDVQKNKFVVQVEGRGPVDIEGQKSTIKSWVIDRFDIAISERESHGEMALLDPAAYKEDWDLLFDRVIEHRYPLDDDTGRTMGVSMTTCDSGGVEGVAENAYSFWKKTKDRGLSDRFSLVKGERPKPNANKPMVSKSIVDKSSKSARKAKVTGEMPLWVLNTTILKDAVAANLKREEVGTDYVHFPDWLGTWFYAEIVAENRTEKGWENPARARNESFDLLCYNKAGYLIKLDGYWKKDINWESPPAWADIWDNNSEVSAKDSATSSDNPTKAKRRRVRMRINR